MRPAIAVLLLIGVGMAAADRAPSRACGPVCALVDAGDDDVRIGHAPAVLPDAPTIARVVEPPCDISQDVTARSAPTADPLIAAPKTSPPV